MIVKDSTLERRLERLGLAGQEDYWAGRYLLCNHLVEPVTAESRQKFEAASRFLRDLVAHRWVRTRQAREDAASKRIHYLSMEFLLGRTLRNNMMNLGVESLLRDTLREAGWDLDELIEEEPDAGPRQRRSRPACRLLHRLAGDAAVSRPSATACATSTASSGSRSQTATRSSSPTTGCAGPIRGKSSRPAEIVRGAAELRVRAAGRGARRSSPSQPSHLAGHCPTIGRSSATAARRINTLRLWAAAAPDCFDFGEFSQRRLRRRGASTTSPPSRSRAFSTRTTRPRPGRALRFLQQYFLVACSLHDIVAPLPQAAAATGTRCPTRSPSR